jgi:hypothetical protein
MGNESKIEGFDEMLRLIYLDQVRMMDAGQLQQEVLRVREGNKGSVPAEEKELMMDRLAAVMKQLSFGELIQSAMQEQQVTKTMILERTGVSSTVIEALGNDAVYPNNVPIQVLKKLVMELRLSYRSVKEAVLKTFNLLQQQAAWKDLSGAAPAFRKGHHLFREGQTGNASDGDGNELFENKEALDKYLHRLEELMNE